MKNEKYNMDSKDSQRYDGVRVYSIFTVHISLTVSLLFILFFSFFYEPFPSVIKIKRTKRESFHEEERIQEKTELKH